MAAELLDYFAVPVDVVELILGFVRARVRETLRVARTKRLYHTRFNLEVNRRDQALQAIYNFINLPMDWVPTEMRDRLRPKFGPGY